MTERIQQLEPLKLVSTLYRRFAEGRLDDTFELMDVDVHLFEPGDPEVLPWAGEFRGHEGLRRFYEGLAGGLSEIAIEPESLELHEIDETRVLALGTERGVSARTGQAYVSQSAWVWTVRDGTVIELRAFHDTAAMSDAMRQPAPGDSESL